MELGLGASFPLWRAPSIPCAPAGTGHCPVGVWAAWKRLMEWLKDPLGMWQHSRARVAVTCFGTSWHPRPAERPQGCLTRTAPVHRAPRAPSPVLEATGGLGGTSEPGSTDGPVHSMLSFLMAHLPSPSCSGTLREPLSPEGSWEPPGGSVGLGMGSSAWHGVLGPP